MPYALLIDDDKALLESVKRTAELAGHDLLTADSWDDGLNLFHVHSPDLVIADYNLPGSRHGLQLIAAIRQLRPSVRLVLLSAYIDEHDIAEIAGLDLVDRAISKVSSTDAMAAVLDELSTAAQRASEPTSWIDFAKAHARAASVDEAALEQLDRRLQGRRGIA